MNQERILFSFAFLEKLLVFILQVSEEDILKSYGGDDKFRTGFYSSNYSR